MSSQAENETFHIDTSRDGVIYFRFAKKYSTEELVQKLEEVTRIIRSQKEKYVLIADASLPTKSNAKNRAALADWHMSTSSCIAEYCHIWIIVLPNSVLRGALTAIFWLKKPECQIKIVASMEEAEISIKSFGL